MDKPTTPRIPAQNDTPADDRVAFHIDNGSTGSPAQRLAQAQHRAEHVANLRRLGDPTALDPADLDNPAVFEPIEPASATAMDDRVTALVGMHDDANQRLAADLAATPPASAASVAAILAARVGEIAHLLGDHADRQDEHDPDHVIDLDTGATVLPQHHALHDAASRLRIASGELRGLAVRLLGAGLVITAFMAGFTVTAPRAEALAVPLVATPLRIVVAGPTTNVTLPVVATRTTDGRHYVAAVTTSTGQTLAATGTSPLLTINGPVWTPGLRLGTQTWTLTDRGDHTTRNVAVTVLRQSRVTLGQPVAIPGSLVLAATASHYDAATGGYRGDQQSVVTFNLRSTITGRTTRITAPTWTDGTAYAIANVPAGLYGVTATRAPGANVTGAVSGSRYAVARPMAPARGE